jgi:hypothetical protein
MLRKYNWNECALALGFILYIINFSYRIFSLIILRNPYSTQCFSELCQLLISTVSVICYCMLAQSQQNITNSEISSPFLQHQVSSLKYQVDFLNIKSTLPISSPFYKY